MATISRFNVWDTAGRGNILVGHSGCHVKHDDCTLALDIVAIPQTSKLLLTCCVPHIEPNGATVGVEDQRVNLHSKGCNILLLKLSSQMSLHKGGLSSPSISPQHQLEGGHVFSCGHLEAQSNISCRSESSNKSL